MDTTRVRDGAFWREQAAVHWASAWAALRATPWVVWLVPVVGFLAILAVGATQWRWAVEKDVQEIIAPTIMTLTLIVAFVTWRAAPQTFTLLVLVGVFSLFLRELHFGFTNWAIYFALAALVWWFSNERKTFAPFLTDRWLRTWLGGAFLTYFVADMFDGHLWRFLPGYWTYNDIAEETLETLGHVQLFCFAVVAMRLALERLPSRS